VTARTGPTVTRPIVIFGASGLLGASVRAALGLEFALRCPTRQECDLATVNGSALADLLASIDPVTVINCAGRTAGTAAALISAHATATATLIEAMAAATPGARLIRLGSAAEYGVVGYGHAVGEDDPADPISAYGLSHLTSTRLGELASRAGRVETVTLRVFNPVGPGLPVESALGRAAMLLRRCPPDGDLAMGLLDTYRDFVDIRDVGLAVRAVVRAPDLPEGVFNVGSGRAVSIRQAVRLVARVAGFAGELRTGEFSPTATRSAGVPWMCADVSRAAQVLGWTPTYDLADSVKALWVDGATPA